MLQYNFEEGRKELFKSGYTQAQVDSINALVNEANSQGIKLPAQLAYVLATAYHECYNPKKPGTRLTPMEEFGGQTYLKSKSYFPYYGRGFVQLTWERNYRHYQPKIKAKFGVDIFSDFSLLLRVDIAAYVTIDGMINGQFTGKKLSDYITSNKTDFQNARRIINGTDKMALIAGYASQFLKCIK